MSTGGLLHLAGGACGGALLHTDPFAKHRGDCLKHQPDGHLRPVGGDDQGATTIGSAIESPPIITTAVSSADPRHHHVVADLLADPVARVLRNPSVTATRCPTSDSSKARARRPPGHHRSAVRGRRSLVSAQAPDNDGRRGPSGVREAPSLPPAPHPPRCLIRAPDTTRTLGGRGHPRSAGRGRSVELNAGVRERAPDTTFYGGPERVIEVPREDTHERRQRDVRFSRPRTR
jgi:hypothetical protein